MPLDSSDILVFDRDALKQKRRRAAQGFADYDFLFQWAANNLRDRLACITRDFSDALQIGVRGGAIDGGFVTSDICDAFTPDIIADEELFPYGKDRLDLVISNLHMHAINDLPGVLAQVNNALRPDGLFIAAMFGGESLHELRASLNAAEMEIRGGLSPRIFPFADKQQMGALLQRAGFALPVVDSDIVTVTYDNMFKLMSDLRGMGEGNIIAARDKRYVGRQFFMRAAQHYAENYAEEDGRIVASFEIIFALGWAPHEGQQKPLRPGSAQNRLADALKTDEGTL